ncbi:MAG: aspartate 1-decarboxylase [Mariprofundaceae bacterium]|nr:aspartate 1-decarboxylase [Mariprofundaceae bacterium]
MQVTMLKSKLHRVCVTHAELDYEGSCAIDKRLMAMANILPFEQLHIYNLQNGARFVTYAIEAEWDSGIISVNGAAAHKASPDDRLIICTYAAMSDIESQHFEPKLVYVDEANKITHCKGVIPVQT